jgi:hypothetical protein
MIDAIVRFCTLVKFCSSISERPDGENENQAISSNEYLTEW